MTRIPYPVSEDLPTDVSDFLSQVPQHAAFDMLSHSIGTVTPFLLQGKAQFTELELPARTRELVILTTAVVTECEYEFVQHVPISEDAGVSPEVRDAIAARQFDSRILSDYDRAVVRFVSALVSAATVADEIFEQTRRQLSPRQIVETIQVAGFYWSFGRLCTVLEIPTEAAHGMAVIDVSRKMQEAEALQRQDISGAAPSA